MNSLSCEYQSLGELASVRQECAGSRFVEISKIADEPSILADGKCQDSEHQYWWIELSRIQEWNQDGLRVLQFSLDLRSEHFHYCTVIEFYEDDRPSNFGAIWKFENGVPSRQIYDFPQK